MLFKLVLLAANAMHWFNPVVYLMLRQADEDIELACDSAATDGLDRAERAAYSRTLLAAVQSNVRALPATTCFGSTVERLKRRITNVLGAQKKRGLGVVALVLALTLTAGCAVSWGERAQTQKNGDPFDDKSYTVDILLYEAPAFTDGFTDGTYPTFRATTNTVGEKYVTLRDAWGSASIYGPMEEYTLEEQSFYALFGSTKASPVDDLIKNNRSAWSGYCEEASDGQPNRVYLLKQKDGTVYVGLAGDYEEDGSELFCSVFRLNEQIDPIYVSMDDYAAARVAELKKGTMTYYVRVNGMGVVEDTVADVRVTQLELGEALEGLSPEGTALELWYFNYEMKPTNESGYPIDPVGGQYVTDDGYLRESWTHYLTVLHHTSGEQTGYQIIGTTMSNDGLFYNGCGYSGEETAYLHDFYVDYAHLDLPKMFIPNLLNDMAADGYGYANQCEARLVAGSGYYYYVPITAWARSSDAEFWYSRYDTGSYFSVEYIRKDVDEALREWTRQGYEVSRSGNVYRIVTSEGMSNTVVTFFSMPNSTCYQVETHWSFDGSTAENEWGWNRDRAVEGEAAILQAMTDSFTITAKILPTQEDADSALDAALKQLGDTTRSASLTLMLNGGKRYEGSATDNRVYFSRQLREDLVWRETNKTSVPQDGLCIAVGGSELNFSEAAPMNLWLTTPDGTLSCFKADVNEDIGSAWSLVRRWYDEAEYDALLRDVKPQPKSLSWQEAAQNWADDYYSAHTKATSGSLFKYTWVKALITPAEDTTKAMRERGEIDGSTYCFTVEVQFTPESETALHYAMAGNTGDCTDPSAPKGAYACWRCCTIQLGSDGLWHGVVLGTGW